MIFNKNYVCKLSSSNSRWSLFLFNLLYTYVIQQLQLNRSLTQYDSDTRIQRLKSRELSLPQSLPLIRLDKEDTQHGILTNRQKNWIEGFPNDPYTENPVLYKYALYFFLLLYVNHEHFCIETGRSLTLVCKLRDIFLCLLI